ncbi:MAG: hypothetical protein JXB29_10940 [Sedimentisphaerales bacterium]|nr:hypothetical protein [Sedimentisphaerales bacterium]
MLCYKKTVNENKFRMCMLVCFTALLLLTSTAFAKEQSTIEQGVKNPGGTATEKPEQAQDVYSDKMIQSFNFDKDIRIIDALRMLAASYGKNIVPSAKVDGVVTVPRLSDVTFAEALDAILGYQFQYEQQNNFIKVYTAEEYKLVKEDKSRMIQKVFRLYYVNAAEMSKLIRPVLSEAGSVAASTQAESGTEAGEGGDSLAMHDTLVVFDYPENIEKVSQMVKEIDVKPSEILIEVTILEAELKDETEFGIDWSDIGGAAVTAASSDGISVTGLASAVTGGAGGSGLSIGISQDNVGVLIRSLESVTDTTVLANPKILALNKQAGHILIGSEDGYLTTTQISADGAVQQVEFLESGTRLMFRPYICRDGFIRMEINPEQSKGEVEVSGGFVLPSKTTTQVKTNIMVKDGKTIVIGGLFKEETSQAYTQVPLFGDLPLIGFLFRQTKDTSVRKELIILITPHIINEPEDTHADERTEDVKQLSDGARESLNWLNRSRIFEDRYAKAVQYYSDGQLNEALSVLNGIVKLRPRYFEAIRLRERIIKELGGKEDYQRIERIMLEAIKKQENLKWDR